MCWTSVIVVCQSALCIFSLTKLRGSVLGKNVFGKNFFQNCLLVFWDFYEAGKGILKESKSGKIFSCWSCMVASAFRLLFGGILWEHERKSIPLTFRTGSWWCIAFCWETSLVYMYKYMVCIADMCLFTFCMLCISMCLLLVVCFFARDHVFFK